VVCPKNPTPNFFAGERQMDPVNFFKFELLRGEAVVARQMDSAEISRFILLQSRFSAVHLFYALFHIFLG